MPGSPGHSLGEPSDEIELGGELLVVRVRGRGDDLLHLGLRHRPRAPTPGSRAALRRHPSRPAARSGRAPAGPSAAASRRVASMSRRPASAVNVSLTATMSSGLWFSSRYVRSAASRGTPAASSRANPAAACARDGCTWIERGDAAASSFSRYGSRAGAPAPAPSRASHSPSGRPSGTVAGQPGVIAEPHLGLGATAGDAPFEIGEKRRRSPVVVPGRVRQIVSMPPGYGRPGGTLISRWPSTRSTRRRHRRPPRCARRRGT